MRNEYFLRADGETTAIGEKSLKHNEQRQRYAPQDEDDEEEEFDINKLRDKVQR
jgi:hypothetical protein